MISLDRITDYILNSINTGIMVLDLTSHLVFLNREAEAMLGESIENLRGRPIVADPRFYPFIVLVNDHRKKNPSLQASRRELAAELCLPGRPPLPVGVTVANLVDETSTVLGYVVGIRDLTEVNRLRTLAARSETLAALGTMAAGVAHEIRNPLHAIRAAVELLEVKGGAGPGTRDYLQIIYGEVERLDGLVEDVLAFARVPRLAKTPSDVNRVAEEAARMVRFPEVVKLGLELGAGLPAVELDPGRIKQVLINLLDNAAQAQPEGGTVTLVTGRAGPRGPIPCGAEALEWVELRVEDSGPGISAEDLPRLFEPFFTKRRAGEGTGLGLSICQKLIEAHGGSLEVDSEPGKGSRFSVFLPVTVGTSPPPRPAGGAAS